MKNKKIESTLYVVSTPIGNDDDISLRALKTINSVDTIICEEASEGALLLKKHNIKKELEELNEHNEDEQTPILIERLKAGESFVLISDCGTPVFADPGKILINAALDENLNIVVVPGASSLLTALVRSGFRSDRFTCAGFLSRKSEERTAQLDDLSFEPRTVVLLETPYRLMPMLESAIKVMPDRKAYIGCNLTMSFESHHYGTFSELHTKFTENKFKGEFVIVFEENSSTSSDYYKTYTSKPYEQEDLTALAVKPAKTLPTFDFIPAQDVTDEDRANAIQPDEAELKRASGSSSDRKDSRGGSGFSRDRKDSRGGSGFSRDRKDSRGGSGFSRDRKDSRGGSGFSRDRKDSRGGSGFSRDRKDSRGGSGFSGDRKDSRGGSGFSGDRKDSRGGSGFSGDRKDSRGGSGFSGDRKDSRGGSGFSGDRKDSRGGSGFSGDRKDSRGGSGFSGDRRDSTRSSYKRDDAPKRDFNDKDTQTINKPYKKYDEVGGGLEAPKRKDFGKPRIYNDRKKPYSSRKK
jgi:16S rRNA (cytidine1402-2'-O)-methyltransferase